MSKIGLILLVSFMAFLVTVNGRALEEEVNTASHSPTTVQVTNDLTGGVVVTMRCQSIQKDLGFKTIPAGKSTGWKVQVNATGDSPTYCHFESWVGTASYEIFNPTRDWIRCPLFCHWALKNDGVHGYQEYGVEDTFFPWPPHRH